MHKKIQHHDLSPHALQSLQNFYKMHFIFLVTSCYFLKVLLRFSFKASALTQLYSNLDTNNITLNLPITTLCLSKSIFEGTVPSPAS